MDGPKSSLELLPVIDLMRQRVVRAVAGQRETYAPWLSPLAPDADPRRLAQVLRDTYHRQSIYVADLDAIRGGELQVATLQAFDSLGLDLWLDAGAGSASSVAQLADQLESLSHRPRLIVGLESVAEPEELTRIAARIPPAQLVLSLDLYHERLWNSAPAWQAWGPIEFTQTAWNAGFRTLIVLDVARVGTGTGAGTAALCRELLEEWPELELIAGGGIRSAEDVVELQTAGCRRALVASALHFERISSLEVLQNGW